MKMVNCQSFPKKRVKIDYAIAELMIILPFVVVEPILKSFPDSSLFCIHRPAVNFMSIKELEKIAIEVYSLMGIT